MSKLALTSRPLTTSTATSVASERTIGRLESVCGAMGTKTQPGIAGCSMGPPADSEYAVDPVGEAMINPSALWFETNLPPTSTRNSTMPDVPPRLTTTSFMANASNTISSPLITRACMRGLESSSYSPRNMGPKVVWYASKGMSVMKPNLP